MSTKDDLRWNTNLEEFVGYYKKYNRIPTLSDNFHSSLGTAMYSWWSNQKRFYRIGKLSPERVSRLNECLGDVWRKSVEEHSNQKAGIFDIPDRESPKGYTDFSISSIAKIGAITTNQFISLQRQGILYYSDMIEAEWKFSPSADIALMRKSGLELPEDWMVVLYCELAKASVGMLYTERDSEDIENLKHFEENMNKIFQKAISDKQLCIIRRRCSGETYQSISNSYNVCLERSRQIYNSTIRVLRRYKDEYSYRNYNGVWLRCDEWFHVMQTIPSSEIPLNTSIHELGLSFRTKLLVQRVGVDTLKDLLQWCKCKDFDFIILEKGISRMRSIGRDRGSEILKSLFLFCQRYVTVNYYMKECWYAIGD